MEKKQKLKIYIGNKIKEVRKQKNIKLIELANSSGIQIATLSRIEHSKMTGTLETHVAIARALAVELYELYKDIQILDKPKSKLT
jgi:transcriptional regulator with XRE-family HTH domain